MSSKPARGERPKRRPKQGRRRDKAAARARKQPDEASDEQSEEESDEAPEEADDAPEDDAPGETDVAARRPRFARDYPQDPRIDALLAAFATGNYGFVRTHAPEIADAAEDDDVRDAARDLHRRIHPEPTSMLLWGLGVLLLVILYAFWLSHEHGG